MGRALYVESVEEAASLAGGYDRLAAALGVSIEEVESWSAGTTIPECSVFLRLLEIVLDPARSFAADEVSSMAPAGRLRS